MQGSCTSNNRWPLGIRQACKRGISQGQYLCAGSQLYPLGTFLVFKETLPGKENCLVSRTSSSCMRIPWQPRWLCVCTPRAEDINSNLPQIEKATIMELDWALSHLNSKSKKAAKSKAEDWVYEADSKGGKEEVSRLIYLF